MATIKQKHLTPAACAVNAFGGVRALARLLGKSPSSVSRWNKPRRKGGSAGSIPISALQQILRLAREKDLKLSVDDLVSGRNE